MAGVNRLTGKPLSGWDHVAQSLGVLFTTPRLSRVMRRHLGSNVPRLVDAPMSPVTIIDVYAAMADAIRFEPRFQVSRFSVVEATTAGQLTIAVEGIYFPRGHLGDFTVQEPKIENVTL